MSDKNQDPIDILAAAFLEQRREDRGWLKISWSWCLENDQALVNELRHRARMAVAAAGLTPSAPTRAGNDYPPLDLKFKDAWILGEEG